MATAKELRVWADTMRQWATRINDLRTGEHLARAAAEVERLASQKEVADRQLV
jgi:hypothetical protein